MTLGIKLEFPLLHEKAVEICNKQGLHARPISQFVEIASRFKASLAVSCNGREVDGKSVLQLMTLAAGRGTELILRSEGDDAEEMIKCLEDLIRARFHED